jgi:putative ABC transport system permease protein
MLKNYLKIALRNLIKFKSYSIINILGLSIGMACCILILLYVQNEMSFDRHHKNAPLIYKLLLERKSAEKISMETPTPPPLAPALINDYPQIVHSVRFLNTDNPIPLLRYGDKGYYEKRFFFVDPDVFEVFTIPFLQGDPRTALLKPNTVVITEETAQKYFGVISPLGKTLTFSNHISLEVTGVMQNSPSNSTLQFDFLSSFSTLYGWLGKEFMDNWQNNMCQTYVLLSEKSSAETLSQQLPGFINKYLGKASSIKKIHLQPLNRIHLFSNQDYQLTSEGDINYIYLLTGVAIFILLIACINFMNLTTARYVRRSNEVGIRKLVGATKKQLVKQFMGESLFLIVISLFIATTIVELSLPFLNAILGRTLEINYFQDWDLMSGPIVIILVVGFLSSSYPAFFLSSLKPIHAFKGRMKTISSKVLFRKILVVVQFTLTITLIIGTLVVSNQLDFMQNKRLGFDGDQVIVVPIRNENLRQNPEPLKSRLLEQNGILNVGAAALLPGGPVGKTRYQVQEISETGSMSMLWVDQDFVRTLNIEMVAGRDFSKDFAKDASDAFIINEEAVKRLGWKTPADAIGKSFELVGSKKGIIIGVVKDFHLTSLHLKIEPVVLHIWPWLNYILVRIDVNQLPGVISDIKKIYEKFDPKNPFEFSFLNDNFGRFYQSERQLRKISGYSTSLAIFIACLGLFGLVSFSIQQKTKEIGIRKALGSSVMGITILLLRGFLELVLFANIIAWPIAYYFMSKWLRDFAYRIDLNIWFFVISAALAFVIALFSIAIQAIKAARANPIEALRYE